MIITDEHTLAAMAAAAVPSRVVPADLAALLPNDAPASTPASATRPAADVLGEQPAHPPASVPSATVALPDLDRAARTVVAARALVTAMRSDDGLLSDDADELVAGLVAMIAVTEASMNALAAQRAALVAVAAAVAEAAPGTMVPMPPDAAPTARDRDHARRALVADIATASGTSEATTATLVDTACEAVTHLPGVLTAMGAGVLGDRHLRQVVRHAEGLPASAMPGYEADVLARLGADRSPAGVGRTARAARERCHPCTAAERHERAWRDRAVHLDPAPDGMAWLTALLPAVQATAIFDKLTGVARRLGTEEGEQRTVAQRRADVLTSLVLDPPSHDYGGEGTADTAPSADTAAGRASPPGAPTADPPEPGAHPDGSSAEQDMSTATSPPGRPPWMLDPALHALRPTVAVTVPVLTLLGASEEPGHLDGYGPIDPDTARALAANAPSFIRLLTHPETGTVLSVGRDRYTVPADLRTWLRLRDQTCRFPGCGRPATRSELDHTVPFRERGATGTTAAENLAHLCARHHRIKHTTRWRVTQDHAGRLTWTAPTGHTRTTHPALGMPGPERTPSRPGQDDGAPPPPGRNDDAPPPPGRNDGAPSLPHQHDDDPPADPLGQ